MADNDIKPYVLVVEDEEPISMLIQYNLEQNGFEVNVEEDGQSALYALEERIPDIVILDWMLPELSGIEVMQRIREGDETSTVPVIMLTARGEETDKLLGLDTGADDYMVKPFSPKELIARIKAVLRRTRPVLSTKMLEFEGIIMDLNKRRVMYNEAVIHVGPTEFKLLLHFMENPGKVYSRSQLLDSVWGTDIYVEMRTVDVHIRRLRKALGEVDPRLEEYVQTVRSAGYMLDRPQ